MYILYVPQTSFEWEKYQMKFDNNILIHQSKKLNYLMHAFVCRKYVKI